MHRAGTLPGSAFSVENKEVQSGASPCRLPSAATVPACHRHKCRPVL
jgi:hypothetical protein